MSGTCLVKIGHDKCGSRDALQVFENEDKTVSGYCFKCHTYIHNPFGESRLTEDVRKEFPQKVVKSKEEIKAEMDEIFELGSCDLPERKLRKASLDAFGVKVGYDERDGKTPRIVFFPYTKDGQIVRYKARLLGRKSMWSIGIDNDVDLFGWEQAIGSGAKKLIITEGEYDAIAMHRILETYTTDSYRDYIPAVVSLPNGSSSASKAITKALPKIKRFFTDVILAFDEDDAGRLAVADVLKILPDAKVATLPVKDANEALLKGMGKAVWRAVTFAAEKPKNTRVVKGSSLKEAAMRRPEMGLSWPYKGLTKLTRGIRRGETYYFGAGVKMGKSELVNDIAKHLIVEHGCPVLLCKPEEDKAETYRRLVGKVAGRIFHDPEIEFDEQAFIEGDKLIGDKALIVDNYQFVNWDNLKDDIRYAVNNEGVHDIIIDPVTCFTNGMSAADTNEFLVGWAAELASMAKDMSFTSYIFCHLKAPDYGPPHERGGQVLSTQFTGSRAMMRSCHLMIGLEGNKDPELPLQERNIRKLKILEDRNFGSTGIVKLYWDHRTGLFNEMRV